MRWSFDPSIGGARISYDKFLSAVQNSDRHHLVKKVTVGQDLADFWGTPLLICEFRELPGKQFFVPLPQEYSETIAELRSRKIVCTNAGLSLVAPLELLTVISLTIISCLCVSSQPRFIPAIQKVFLF